MRVKPLTPQASNHGVSQQSTTFGMAINRQICFCTFMPLGPLLVGTSPLDKAQ